MASVLDVHKIPNGERDNDSFASAEYGAEETAFNEDGSFIGVYHSREEQEEGAPSAPPAPPAPPAYHEVAESVV